MFGVVDPVDRWGGTMSSPRWLVVGANSAIAAEVALQGVKKIGGRWHLVGRQEATLQALAAKLLAAGAQAASWQVSASLELAHDGKDPWGIQQAWDQAVSALAGAPNVLVLAQGVLPDQNICEQDFSVFEQVWRVNFTSIARWSLVAFAGWEKLADPALKPTLAVFGSVAGDRGRASNYIYGASKAALATLCEGLTGRGWASPAQIRVVTIKPGPVATPMTAHLNPKQLPFLASPASVATAILQGILAGQEVVYAPWIWRWIMMIIRCLPSKIAKRMF